MVKNYRLTAEQINKLIGARADRSRVLVPVQSEERVELEELDENYDAARAVDFFRPFDPLKSLVLSPFEKVAEFPHSSQTPDPAEVTLYGVKACSVNHLRLLDEIMLDEEIADSFYQARREKLFIISCDCQIVEDTCFCTEVGLAPHPTTGNFDLNIAHIEGEYLLTVGSERGGLFLEEIGLDLAEAGPETEQQLEEQRQRIAEEVAEKNQEFEIEEDIHRSVRSNRDAEVYREKAEDCVECGGCNLVCSSCYCFYLADRPEDQTSFSRFRLWDSCQFNAYARVAGDESPRPLLMQRIRHRIAHKFDYLEESMGFYGCVGCGRCISACPAGIDIRSLLAGVKQ